MAQPDPLERLTKIWEQQRNSIEQAVERLGKTGRRVAEAISDTVKRAAPNDDVRAAIDRFEKQQREIMTRLAEVQREAVERIISASTETTETLWSNIRTAIQNAPRPGQKAAKSGGAKPASQPTEAREAAASPAAAKAPAARKAPAKRATAKATTAKKAPAKKAPAKKT